MPTPNMDGVWVLVTGSPTEGFEFIGPFESADHATNEAEAHWRGYDWWVATLHKPDLEESE